MKPISLINDIFIFITILKITQQWCLKNTIIESQTVYSVDYSPDGTMIAVAADRNSIKVYDTQTLAVKFSFSPTGNNAVKVVKFNNRNTILAIGMTNGTLFIMDLTTPNGATVQQGTSLITGMNSIDFNSNSNLMLITGENPDLLTFNTANWNPSNGGYSAGGRYVGGQFTMDDRIVVISSTSGMVSTHSSPYTSTGRRENGSYSGNNDYSCFAIRYDSTGDSFIAGKSNGRGHTNPSNQNNAIHSFNNGNILSCAYSRNLDYFVFTGSGSDQFLSFYNATNKNNSLVQRIPIPAAGQSIDFSNDGQYLVVGLTRNVQIYQQDCVVCQPTHYYNITLRVCQLCSSSIIGCGFCQLSTTCTICIQGYYLLPTNFCQLCQVSMPGCSTCLNQNECVEVFSGYYLTTSKKPEACQTSLIGCLACTSSSNCLQCSNQYFLSGATLKTCASCSNIHSQCLFCNSSTQCTQCGLGFFQENTQCTQCSFGCLTCSNSANNCTSCGIGLYLSGSSCQKCVDNCIECNSTLCFNCINGFFLNTDTCESCLLPCLTCSLSADSCLTCISGYFKSSTQCLACSYPCVTCTSLAACLTCIEGFYYDVGTSSCKQCVTAFSGCQSCNSSTCSWCFGGYYLDSGECFQCNIMYGCTSCSSQISCQFCSIGLYLSPIANQGNDSCLSCSPSCSSCSTGSVCQSCLSGHFLQSTSCVICQNPCVTCISATDCNSCLIGYYLDGNICFPCDNEIQNCLVCYQNSSNVVCLQCISSMTVSSNICISCEPGCLQCSNGICQGCGLGLYLEAENCLPCNNGCLTCLDLVNCVACNIGFSISGSGDCIRCDFPCLTCGNSMECLTCPVSYFLDSGHCLSCLEGISSCLQCSSSLICTHCAYGYTLVIVNSTTSCSSCTQIEGCINCESTNCLSCLSTYFLKEGTCSPCPQGCSSCFDGTTCGKCLDGFFEGTSLDVAFNGKCLICGDHIEGCIRCNNFDTCSGCSNGYLLQSGECVRCRQIWAFCDICQASNCEGCQGGYFLSQTKTCQQCSTSFQGCRLCSPDGQNCQACQSGYYLALSAPLICHLCTENLQGCTICNSSSICLACYSGYYLDNIYCRLCSEADGCMICDSAVNCTVCISGYYLDGVDRLCKVCQTEGCEICNVTQPTKCLSCTALYYKSNLDTCLLCSEHQAHCITCVDDTTCQSCSSGFFLQSQSCQQCSLSLPGCQQCKSQIQCVQCQSMYYLISNSCQLCSSAIQGCLYCADGTSCVSCGVGYYLQLGICKSCNNLEGCVLCAVSNLCLVCGTGYFIENGNCQTCGIIAGCYSCLSQTVCTSCAGGYSLNSNNECDLTQGSSNVVNIQKVTDIEIRSVFENSTVLKHFLYSKNTNFVKSEIDWQRNIDLYVKYPNGVKENLEILSVQWSQINSYTIIIYTSNPFTNQQNQLIFNPVMPFTRRLLQSISKFGIIGVSIDENTIKRILPYSAVLGVMEIQNDLQSPQFYISYIRNYNGNSNFHYFIVGAIVTGFMFLMFLIKALITVPLSENLGNIMPHILAHKVGALLVYPTYLEFISYCSGFMYADFPWMNTLFGETLSDPRDKVPLAYRMFYVNMNVAGMYLLALCVLVILVFVGILVGQSVQQGSQKMYGYFRVLYNFFGFGLVFAGCASLQGAILNPLSTLNVNATFYIIGILAYFLMIFQCIFKNVKDFKLYFWKIRVVIKATLLSLSHFSPIYLLSSAIALDFVLICIENNISFYPKRISFCWIITNVLMNCSLAILVFMPNVQISLIIVSILIVFVLVTEIFMQYFETKNNMVTADIAEKDYQIWNLSNEKIVDKSLRVSENTLMDENNHLDNHKISEQLKHDDMQTLGTSRYKRQRKFKKVRGGNNLKNGLKVEENIVNNDNVNKSNTKMIEIDEKDQNMSFMFEEMNEK